MKKLLNVGLQYFIHTIYWFICILGLKELISTAEYTEEVLQPVVLNTSVWSSVDKIPDCPVRLSANGSFDSAVNSTAHNAIACEVGPIADEDIASARSLIVHQDVNSTVRPKAERDACAVRPKVDRDVVRAVRPKVVGDIASVESPKVDGGIARRAVRPKADKGIVTAGRSKVDKGIASKERPKVDKCIASTGHPQVDRGIASVVRTQVDSVPTGEMDKGKFTAISQNSCNM